MKPSIGQAFMRLLFKKTERKKKRKKKGRVEGREGKERREKEGTCSVIMIEYLSFIQKLG